MTVGEPLMRKPLIIRPFCSHLTKEAGIHFSDSVTLCWFSTIASACMYTMKSEIILRKALLLRI